MLFHILPFNILEIFDMMIFSPTTLTDNSEIADFNWKYF